MRGLMSVAVAAVLWTCPLFGGQGKHEISDAKYERLGRWMQQEPKLVPVVLQFLADSKISNDEFRRIEHEWHMWEVHWMHLKTVAD